MRRRGTLGSALGIAGGMGLVASGWFAMGPDHPLFPVVVTALWFGVAALIGPGIGAALPARWSAVPAGESRWHRRLSVDRLDRFLEVTGWNRSVRAMHGPSRSPGRAGLAELRQHVVAAMAGHGLAAGVHLLLALACVAAGAAGGAAATLATGALLHGWPLLLQRSVLLRLQRVSQSIERATGVVGSPRLEY